MSIQLEKEIAALGILPGKAWGILRKNILFSIVKKASLDICYRCGEKIHTSKELSVDHKIDWIDSIDPVFYFFDIENIAFSHLKCNISHGSKKKKGRIYKPKPLKEPKVPKPIKIKKIILVPGKEIIGRSGGMARARKLVAERRSQIARKAAKARWNRKFV